MADGYHIVFPGQAIRLSDTLTYSDGTSGPAGEFVSIPERIAEIDPRNGPTSLVVRAIEKA